LHLLSNQPTARLHSQLDMSPLSRASKIAGREAITMHPKDAGGRGIRDGDVVRVSNQRGAFLAGARLSDDLRENVVQIATGAWYQAAEPGVPGSLDTHGNPNMVTMSKMTSPLAGAPTAQTVLVQIERVDDAPPMTAFDPPRFS
jgi:biotin/methionine sulfoxide reductase